jgi:hypothetical protein
MKTCFKCGETKLLEYFYKHLSMKDGYLNKCKLCTRKDNVSNRISKIDKIQEYDRIRCRTEERYKKNAEFNIRYNKTDKGKLAHKKWIDKNRNKREAHYILNNAISKGEIVKGKCEQCKSVKTEAHHEDYSKPLEVKWLCNKHHTSLHRLEREQKRKLDNIIDPF